MVILVASQKAIASDTSLEALHGLCSFNGMISMPYLDMDMLWVSHSLLPALNLLQSPPKTSCLHFHIHQQWLLSAGNVWQTMQEHLTHAQLIVWWGFIAHIKLRKSSSAKLKLQLGDVKTCSSGERLQKLDTPDL